MHPPSVESLKSPCGLACQHGSHFSNKKVCCSDQNLTTWTSLAYLALIPFPLYQRTLHQSFGWGWGSALKGKCTQRCRENRPKCRIKGCASQSAPRPELPCPTSGHLPQKVMWPPGQGGSRRRMSLAGAGRGGLSSASEQGGAGCRAGSGPCTEQLPGSVDLPC